MEARVLMRDQLLKAVVKKWFRYALASPCSTLTLTRMVRGSFQHALQNLSEDEASQEYDELMATLREYEFSLERAEEVVRKNEEQRKRSEEQAKQQAERLEALKARNAELKAAYKQAKITRTHYEEYTKLAELISKVSYQAVCLCGVLDSHFFFPPAVSVAGGDRGNGTVSAKGH